MSSVSFVVQEGNQRLLFTCLRQFFPGLNLADFRGTITGETTGQMAVTEIRQSGSPLEFATLPVAEIIP